MALSVLLCLLFALCAVCAESHGTQMDNRLVYDIVFSS